MKPQKATRSNRRPRGTSIDVRDESDRRYPKRDSQIVDTHTPSQREREYEEDHHAVGMQEEIDNRGGNGSKTEGAFGKEHGARHSSLNTRYRRDEVRHHER